MHDNRLDLAGTIPASPQLEQLLDERDTILTGVAVRLGAELAAVRATEPRADTKAGQLQQLCSGLLLAGLALLSSGKLPGPAAVFGWAAAALLIAAVTLLSTATRPNLGGGRFGFVRWARLADDQDLIAEVAGETDLDADCTRQAQQLRWLSRSLYGKFCRIRTAQTLFVTALAAAAIAAALTAIGR
jgi:amino acid transporter